MCECASCTAPAPGRWRTTAYDDGTAEVVPIADVIGHDASDDCACGPRQDAVKRDDGSMGWVVVHHSLDGREFQEA